MDYKYIGSREVKNQRAIGMRTSQIMKWTYVKYPKLEVVLNARDRVNIPCLVHDTPLCQFDVSKDYF